MARSFFSFSSLIAAGLLLAVAAQAEPVTVIHAIPGTAIGLPSDQLAVDIAVGGGCAFPGVEFGQSGSADLAVGTYDVVVSLSDGSCSGTDAIVGSFDVSLGETVVVIAHLTEAGSPVLTKISVDGSDTDARVTIFHGAGAPPVRLRGWLAKSKIKVRRLSNGAATFPVDGEEGNLSLKINPADGGRSIFSARGVPAAGNLIVIAAGTLATGTFQPVIVEISEVP